MRFEKLKFRKTGDFLRRWVLLGDSCIPHFQRSKTAGQILIPALVRGAKGFLQTQQGVPPGGQGPPVSTCAISQTQQNLLVITVDLLMF